MASRVDLASVLTIEVVFGQPLQPLVFCRRVGIGVALELLLLVHVEVDQPRRPRFNLPRWIEDTEGYTKLITSANIIFGQAKIRASVSFPYWVER